MSAAVLSMSDHRAVFVLLGVDGTAVFLASRGPRPRIAYEIDFTDSEGAAAYAQTLALRFGCRIVGIADESGEDVV